MLNVLYEAWRGQSERSMNYSWERVTPRWVSEWNDNGFSDNVMTAIIINKSGSKQDFFHYPWFFWTRMQVLEEIQSIGLLKSSNHSPVSYSWLLVLIFLQGNLIFKHLFIILEHVSIKFLVFRVNQCSIDMHSMFVKLICFAVQACNHFIWNAWQWKGQRNEVA